MRNKKIKEINSAYPSTIHKQPKKRKKKGMVPQDDSSSNCLINPFVMTMIPPTAAQSRCGGFRGSNTRSRVRARLELGWLSRLHETRIHLYKNNHNVLIVAQRLGGYVAIR